MATALVPYAMIPTIEEPMVYKLTNIAIADAIEMELNIWNYLLGVVFLLTTKNQTTAKNENEDRILKNEERRMSQLKNIVYS